MSIPYDGDAKIFRAVWGISARISGGVKSGRVWAGGVGASLRDQRGTRVPCGAVSGGRTGTLSVWRVAVFSTEPVELTLQTFPLN
jgi:hypothetical protein